MNSPIALTGYLALFVGLGFLFLFGNLLIGRLVRPKLPNREKLEVYECGEPTIGSSFVQFDLRFYVVALLFIIFDVEVAFFFPWATVYGKATHLMDPTFATVQAGPTGEALTPAAADLFRELGVSNPTLPQAMDGGTAADAVATTAGQLAMLSIFDIGVFFAVLLVGFAYVWKRGDLDWVRALSREKTETPLPRSPATDMVLSA
jgi:NADH-quinone oxidoreductase subunit A